MNNFMNYDKEMTLLDKEFVDKYKYKTPKWGFNGLGYIVYKRTYSRIKDDGTNEEWYETVERCINGAQKLGAGYTKEEMERLYDHVFNLRCNFAGRMLWQLGTKAVERYQSNGLLNCWFTAMRKPDAFLFLFENLMLGGGVGFSIRREDVHELPKVKKGVKITHVHSKDATFIVPDSREGWVELLNQVLNAYYVSGKSFTYSTLLVRGAGERISGFGGTASGPGILIEGMEKICQVFESREGKKLRSVDVLDVCNIIGSIVVAGNVRRSAEIAIGDPDDYLFLRAKNWSSGKIPNTRSMSNNTIYADSFEQISEDLWTNGYEVDKMGHAKGEPYGFFNLRLSQGYGRIKDGPMQDCSMYPVDIDSAEGTNPCGEISLSDRECCNLVELYLNNIHDKETLFDCAKLLYKTQKAISAGNFIHEETNKIVHKNMRLGMGITGICQALDKIDWLDECYVRLRNFDKEWSKKRGWNESIKLTTVKPSGTLSLLGGSTPGIHPAYSKYYIRRVRMSSDDRLVAVCRKAGYKVEYLKRFDGTDDYGTSIVEFPCETPDGSLLAKDVDVIQQLELVKKMQNIWSDNAVSVTAYYKPEELDTIKDWMKANYEGYIKSVSFLLHSNHGFVQAPYEEITESEYKQRIAKVKDISLLTAEITAGKTLEGIECAGGSCPIK